MEPYRTDLMEYYSTALWHLQQEVSLSALAQDMLEQDKMSAATWCCAGNCLDLQKDREQALKFFQRAIQVDPKFAYAYTLLGHQYLALEETEKAMDCFKNAVRVESKRKAILFCPFPNRSLSISSPTSPFDCTRKKTNR